MQVALFRLIYLKPYRMVKLTYLKIKKSILTCILLCSTYYIALSIESKITGKAECFKGEKISLLIYKDLITNTEKEIATSTIDSSGNFTLNFKLYATQYAIIKINYLKKSFAVEPGKQYNISIVSDIKLSSEQINSTAISDYINLIIFNDSLNQQLGELNEVYDNFIIANTFELTVRGGQKKVEELELKLSEQFSSFKNHYFQQSLQYKMASLKLLTHFYNNDKFAEIYFLNKPILYLNIEYMEVFNQYFTQYLKEFSYKSDDELSLKDMINFNADYDNITHLLYQDYLLHNDTLREAVLLKNLFELYYDNNYKSGNIQGLIRYMENCAMYKSHRNIAENINNIINPSTKTIDFTLHDVNGKTVSLSNFKGKYVYLNFWKSEIPESTIEFEAMNEYYAKCKEKVEFISICTDSKPEKMKAYLQQHPQYTWTFLYYDKRFDLLEAYKVTSFPSFILINPQGEIINYAAPRPTERLDDLLTQIMNWK